MSRLTIISHTEHYLLADGSVVGLGSTVTEINHLLEVFESITHVAMLHDVPAPPGALPYVSDQITFVALPAVGGPTIDDKIALVFQAPKILKTVRKALKGVDYFQFRAPTGIGVFVVPYLIMWHSKKGWFKYAGNWKPSNAPLVYRFQKWLLEKQSRPVTINGFWADQPQHCLSFENPCLTEAEIQTGQRVRTEKRLTFPLELCFVGRLEAAKGVDLIIEAVSKLNAVSLCKIGTIHMVGEGVERGGYQKCVDELSLPITFHGYLSRPEVHEIYKKSHAIILPSASEGFPKVIAEAMNYGCIPIVSDVSSISHYIRHKDNGFLIKSLDVSSLKDCFLVLLDLEPSVFKHMASNSSEYINRFSYTQYNERLIKDVL